MLCQFLICVAAASGSPLPATDNLWFNLTGDRTDPNTESVEIRPERQELNDRVLIDLRVSRKQTRTSFKGLKYRSYNAKAVVNCTDKKGWYLWLEYHSLPSWVGPVVGREEYAEGQAQVLFKDMNPEWATRLVSAACASRKRTG